MSFAGLTGATPREDSSEAIIESRSVRDLDMDAIARGRELGMTSFGKSCRTKNPLLVLEKSDF